MPCRWLHRPDESLELRAAVSYFLLAEITDWLPEGEISPVAWEARKVLRESNGGYNAQEFSAAGNLPECSPSAWHQRRDAPPSEPRRSKLQKFSINYAFVIPA
jgi:hypothetical protein